MKNKKRFRWGEKKERTVSEIISEDGTLGQQDVLYISEKLCSRLESTFPGENSRHKALIHPGSVVVDIHGDVRIADTESFFSSAEPYLPPEWSSSDPYTPGAAVYAIGMLMLFMATGKGTKSELNTGTLSRTLRSLIQRCTAFDPKERFSDLNELMTALRQETGSGKKVRSVLALLFLICLTGGPAFFFGREGMLNGSAAGERKGYRSGFKRGFEQGFSDMPGIGISEASPDGHNGNLSGNMILAEGPFAARSEEEVFYLTEKNLCRMDPYTQEVEVMAEMSDAYDLQYHNGYLYYCVGENLCRMDIQTAEAETVCESGGMKLYIFNDTIYLYDKEGTGYLYRVDIEGGALIQLNGAASFHCLNIVDGQLYYISPENDHCLCRSDIDGGNQSVISSGVYESMCIYNGSIIAAAGDGLIRMNLNGGNPENILSGSAYEPNVSDGGIFYVSGQRRTLEWMSLDGRVRYTVVPTGTGSFNVAGQWIFYKNEDDGGSLWRVRIGGSDNVRISQ